MLASRKGGKGDVVDDDGIKKGHEWIEEEKGQREEEVDASVKKGRQGRITDNRKKAETIKKEHVWVTDEGTAQFLSNYMAELHAFIVRVRVVFPKHI